MEEKIYGHELIINLSGCNLQKISTKEVLIEYVDKLCKLINMKKLGETIAENFGFGKDFTAGYSIVQLIETSSITGHFSNLWRKAYINVFSCQEFDPKAVEEFTKDFFEAEEIKTTFLVR